MHKRYSSFFIVVATLVLACESPGDHETEGVGDGGGDGIGDGIGDDLGEDAGEDAGEDEGEDAGEGDDYCDFADIPQREPVWLLELAMHHKGDKPRAFGLAVGEEAVFSAGYSPDGSDKNDLFMEGRSLDAELEWSTSVESYGDSSGRSLGWDTEHLYYITSPTLNSNGLARLTADGEPDPWSFPGQKKLWLSDIDVSSSDVLAAGFMESEKAGTSFDDAVFVQIDKSDDSVVYYDETGEPLATEKGHAVTPWPSGGHIGVTRGSHEALWLRGYNHASLSSELMFEANELPAAVFVTERLGEYLLLGGHTEARSWVSLVDEDGQERWRKLLSPCGPGAAEGLRHAVVGSDRVWGVVTGPDREGGYPKSFIVEIGFDGSLEASYRVVVPHEEAMIEAIATNGSAVVVSGFSVEPEGALSGWMARVI
ncbi:hypothetical protein ENSA5_13830 [Enhygromyxa salina]|uniref:Uncharacterized protein n=1 Tax=Enhygromyxa salina TaxID=215803 RepID=A0A2S9YET8_9BACT|nr:hypothetical protein [Enhygromyxa salina]PRQ03628.1 hypothetical protein ENSA5_13830 [Enhygromyxa salina]